MTGNLKVAVTFVFKFILYFDSPLKPEKKIRDRFQPIKKIIYFRESASLVICLTSQISSGFPLANPYAPFVAP